MLKKISFLLLLLLLSINAYAQSNSPSEDETKAYINKMIEKYIAEEYDIQWLTFDDNTIAHNYKISTPGATFRYTDKAQYRDINEIIQIGDNSIILKCKIGQCADVYVLQMYFNPSSVNENRSKTDTIGIALDGTEGVGKKVTKALKHLYDLKGLQIKVTEKSSSDDIDEDMF